MTKGVIVGGLLAAVATGRQALAGVVISDVQVGGTLSAGASYSVGTDGLAFSFPAAKVGRSAPPPPYGGVSVAFIVEGTAGEVFTQDTFTVLGDVGGDYTLTILEKVMDLTSGGSLIGWFSHYVHATDPHPYTWDLVYSRGSSKVKVTTTVFLDGKNGSDVNYAEATSLDFRFIPTPGALAVAALVGFSLERRRRPAG